MQQLGVAQSANLCGSDRRSASSEPAGAATGERHRPSARWAACTPAFLSSMYTGAPHAFRESPAAAGIGVAARPSSRRRSAAARCVACPSPLRSPSAAQHLFPTLIPLQAGMATLVCRPGDPQALKAAAAAAAAGASLSVLPLAESAQWKKLLTDSSDAAASKQLLLVLPDGSALAEPNAIARFLGGCWEGAVGCRLPRRLVRLGDACRA